MSSQNLRATSRLAIGLMLASIVGCGGEETLPPKSERLKSAAVAGSDSDTQVSPKTKETILDPRAKLREKNAAK